MFTYGAVCEMCGCVAVGGFLCTRTWHPQFKLEFKLGFKKALAGDAESEDDRAYTLHCWLQA